MKTLSVIVSVVLIMGSFCGVLSRSGADSLSEDGSYERVAEEMLARAKLFMDGIGISAVTLGLVFSFLTYRFTFGRRIARVSSLPKFATLSLIPSLVLLVGLIIKRPGELLVLFVEVFPEVGFWVLSGSVAAVALGFHGIFSLLVDPGRTETINEDLSKPEIARR